MAQRILILNGHPDHNRLCSALADRYEESARQHASVRRLNLAEMEFDANLQQGYARIQPLEPDLQAFQQALTECDHLVLIAPVWWGSIPARLKGLFDRTLLPGFAFRYEQGQSLPEQLLKGRSAHVMLTLDTPAWYFRWFQKAPAVHQLDNATLRFCGFRPVRTTLLGPVIKATEHRIEGWLQQAAADGRRGR